MPRGPGVSGAEYEGLRGGSPLSRRAPRTWAGRLPLQGLGYLRPQSPQPWWSFQSTERRRTIGKKSELCDQRSVLWKKEKDKGSGRIVVFHTFYDGNLQMCAKVEEYNETPQTRPPTSAGGRVGQSCFALPRSLQCRVLLKQSPSMTSGTGACVCDGLKVCVPPRSACAGARTAGVPAFGAAVCGLEGGEGWAPRMEPVAS